MAERDAASLLAWGAAALADLPEARLDAEVLLATALGLGRERVYAGLRDAVDETARARFEALVRERAATRCPVAYLTGVKEFAGLRLAARRGVFIPRPETEGLVEVVAEWFRERGTAAPAGPVVDACCGSGAVGIALALALGRRVVATDISPAAIALTRENASRCHAGPLVTALAGSLLDPVVEAPAAVVSNPPYVRAALLAGLDRGIREHEPRAALDGGSDGLDVVRALAGQSARRLAPGGLLALEIGEEQGEAVRGLLAGAGWRLVRIERDLAGLVRYALAEAPLRTRAAADRVFP